MTTNPTSRPRDIAELVQFQSDAAPDIDILTFVNVEGDGSLTDERRTFHQLHSNASRLANFLRAQGLSKGDRFALMLNNHPEFVEAMIAAALLGATFVPLDPRSLGDKLVYMLNFVECKLVIAGEYALPALSDVSEKIEQVRTIVALGDVQNMPASGRLDFHTYKDCLLTSSETCTREEPDPSGIMFMMFTSGTTGHPKAVVRKHGDYMKGIKGLRALGVSEGDRLFTGLPLSHINAQSTLGAGLSLALPVVISRKFTKSRLWDICRAYDCTMFTLLGGMIPEIYSVPEAPDDNNNPVRLVISSGMPAALWDEYKRRFEIEVTEVYGSTEAGGVLINLMSKGPVGSMGKPPTGTVAAILDEAGDLCPPGIPGELCFHREDSGAPAVTYFRNENASQQKTRDGWFRTGDIAHMDAEGWFFFHHRAGGGVRRNGDFVNTTLVETVLSKSPHVADVFVYGVSTSGNVAGEKTVVASVVLTPGGSIDEVGDWCASRLQKNEIPQVWQVLAAIPKTNSEKPVERDCIALLKLNNTVEPA